MGEGQGAERKLSATARRQGAAEARRRKEAMRRNAALVGVAVVFVAVLGVCLSQRTQDQKAQGDLVAQLTAGDCRYDTRTDPGSEHVARPNFEVNPPAGGDHTPEYAAAGIYEGDVPPDGPLVHAMEHGFIVLWYRAGDAEAKAGAEALGREFSEETLVVPRGGLDVAVAATAWHRRLLCPSVEDEPLAAFIRGYRDQGPEKGFL